jgi:hypothetical protein
MTLLETCPSVNSISAAHPDKSIFITCQGFVPLYADFETFFLRHLYRRSRDCWNRPITGVPGGYFDVLERRSPDFNWTFQCVRALIGCHGGLHKTFALETCGPKILKLRITLE